MNSDTRLAFHSNPNKDFLRATYDKSSIAAWRMSAGRRLLYLGLPGPEMLDIIEWQDHLERFTTIERRENEQHLLFLRANVEDVEHRLYSLYGELDEILLTGRDAYGHAPRWPYDVVNLDYFGGFLYRDLSRPRALKKLIENQDAYDRSFLLIVTHDLRDSDTIGEKLGFFDDLARMLARDAGPRVSVLEFVARCKDPQTPDVARQAIYMNVFLRDAGEAAGFRVLCRPAVSYIGTGGTKMVHYVTEFRHERVGHRAVSDQSLVELVNLGVQELVKGQFTPAPRIPVLPIA